MELPWLFLRNSFSLTDFQRNAKSLLERLNKTKEPALITVNGKVEAVLLDPDRFEELQRIEECEERRRFIEAIKEGIEDLDAGRTRPASEVIAELRAKYGF